MQTTLVDERWLLVGQGGNIGYSVTESWCLQKVVGLSYLVRRRFCLVVSSNDAFAPHESSHLVFENGEWRDTLFSGRIQDLLALGILYR